MNCGCGGTGRRAGLRNQCQRRGGSSPFIRTNDVSVRTNKTDRYKNQSGNQIWLIFLLSKTILMIDVYNEQVKDLIKIVPTFKIAIATIHFDETSPHMHIVGVPVIEDCTRGMKKQVGKK